MSSTKAEGVPTYNISAYAAVDLSLLPFSHDIVVLPPLMPFLALVGADGKSVQGTEPTESGSRRRTIVIILAG